MTHEELGRELLSRMEAGTLEEPNPLRAAVPEGRIYAYMRLYPEPHDPAYDDLDDPEFVEIEPSPMVRFILRTEEAQARTWLSPEFIRDQPERAAALAVRMCMESISHLPEDERPKR